MRAIARSFTRLDQVTQLVNASEADAELGYMARLLCIGGGQRPLVLPFSPCLVWETWENESHAA